MKAMIKQEAPRKAIIFCNTKEQVDNIFEIMHKWDRRTCAVHGEMEQSIRSQTLKAFKKGTYHMLVATDLAARGLHVRDLTHVINYSVPFEQENYIHRIGRTGRVDQKGVGIMLVIPKEMSRFKELGKYLGYEIPCRGGHVIRQTEKVVKGKQRFKDTNNTKLGVSVKNDMKDQFTTVNIYNNKSPLVIKGITTKKIKGKLYRVKQEKK